LSLYEFALMVQIKSENILSDDENSRLKNIVQELEQALENLDDVTKFENLKKELIEFYNDLPIACDLGRAENAASVIEDDYPDDAKQIRQQAKKLADLYMHQNKDLIESARETLYVLIDSNVSWANIPSGRFDRDVRL
jgi:hypothetical protein